jgi:hypothetical protein
MDGLDLFTVNTSVIDKVLKGCGIENTTVIFRGNDYFISIKDINEKGFDLIIKDVKKTIKTEDIIKLVITFEGKRYLLTLEVSKLRLEEGKIIIETKIKGKVNLEVRNKLDEILEALKFLDNRKFNRITIDNDILNVFNIIPRMKIIFIRKEYVAYIKNISAGGIAFLTTVNFMKERDEVYNLHINFTNPAENITVKGELLRRNIVNVQGTEFVEVAMKIHENIYLNKRIIDYFKKYEIKAKISN